MNAAITGGTGFLGRALLPMLVDRFDAVRALVRRPDDDARIRATGAQPIRGDLSRPGGCEALIEPGDTVFHAAARVDMQGSWVRFQQATIGSTRRLLEAALPQKPRRMVYVSSAGVYSPQQVRAGASATQTPAAPPRCNLYGRAKLEAERLIRTECDQARCPWTIVRLGFLYGPGNRPLLRHFVPMLQRGYLRHIGSGENRIATLYVDDAARAIVMAGLHGEAAGKIYDVASDERVTQKMLNDAHADAVGLPRPTRHTQRPVAYAVAWIAEWVSRLSGRESPLTRAMVMLMSTDQNVDASLIRSELGWRPQVRFQDGMKQMAAWYRTMGPDTRSARRQDQPAQVRSHPA